MFLSTDRATGGALEGVVNTYDLQIQYWNQFSRLKRDAFYISYYHAKVDGIERWLNIFAAAASAGAITAWAAKHELAAVWGVIILLSQLLTAVRPHLPYRSELKALGTLGPDLEALALVAETDWLKVARASIEDDEIHKRTMTLKKKAHEAQERSFKGASLPRDQKLETRAEVAAEDYMSTYVSHSEEGDSGSTTQEA